MLQSPGNGSCKETNHYDIKAVDLQIADLCPGKGTKSGFEYPGATNGIVLVLVPMSMAICSLIDLLYLVCRANGM